MKTKFYLTTLLVIVIRVITYGQNQQANITQDNKTPFNLSFWSAYADKLHLNPSEKKEFISAHQKIHENSPNNQSTPTASNLKPLPNAQSLFAGPCVNIDFENGNYLGWSPTCGYHPVFNPLGCCPMTGGQQMVVTGNGNDPAGGFPLVAPGGNFSLRLGDNQTGGEADRIEQTFMVSANNANFTYRYAVVFQDPGHNTAEQPAFAIEMLDSTGTQVPCTYYNVSAGGNIPGFFNSTTQAGVVYKPWTNVLVDLTNYIGQNITIRFTTYDCALGGHYGYAYIDGSCQAFVSGTADTICIGAVKNFCAPTGLGTYAWNGPGIVNQAGQCLNATAAGIYTCSTTLVTGCTGPVFTYTLSHYPDPVAAFTSTAAGPCSLQRTFLNGSTVSSGAVSSYSWNFGTGTSNQQNPTYTYTVAGTYNTTLSVSSNNGCTNVTSNTIIIHPNPVVSFNAPSTCKNAAVNFTNTSNIASGSILSYTWNFGNGNTSQVVNPTQNYTNDGNFGVNLSAMSNMGCIANITNPVVIYPLPVINFNGSNVCQGTGTSFFNNSTITSGNIATYSWDLDNNGTPDATTSNAQYLYNAPGTYSITLLATSNFGCVNVGTNTVAVYAMPTATFATQNVCYGNANIFTNQSSIAPGNAIISNAWNFGDVSYSYQHSPQHTYFNPGTYSITLTVTSNNNCVSVFSATTAVHSVPTVNFMSNNACQNQTTQFNNTTIITGGIISKWRWDFQDDGIWDDSTNVNPTIVYPGYGNYNCRLQAITNFQCSSQKVNPVIVYANPIANFVTKSTCLGDVTTFTNLSTSPGGVISSNQWDFNGDNVIDNLFASPTATYSANGTYLVKLEVQTIHGCTDVKSKSVYVNPKPVPLFAGKNRIGCPQLCVSFTNSSTIATGNIVTTQWLFGDGSMPDYSQNPKHCYGTGNYNVTLKLVSDSGCISTMNQPSFVQVYPIPVAGFKVEPEEIDEMEPNISVKSEASDAVVTNYYINDGSNYSGPNFSHALKNADKAKPMIFQVVMNEHGCGDTTYKELNIKPSWVVYIPNTFTPNGDGVNDGFFAKGYNIKDFNLKIFDRWGHILFETNDINQAWDGTTRGSDEAIKQDVYVWKAYIKDVYNKNHDLTGHVSLIK